MNFTSIKGKDVNCRHFGLLLLSLILCAIFIEHLPSELGTSLLGLAYIIFGISILLFMIVTKHYTIPFYRNTYLPELSICAIAVVSTYHILAGNFQTYQNALSALFFLSILAFNIYFIPFYVRKSDFFLIMSRLSLLFVLVPALLVPLAMVSDQVMTLFWWGPEEIGPFTYRQLISFTENPNSLGQILFVGLVCTFGLYEYSRDRRELYISIIIFAGLILTQNRYSWLAVTTAGVVFLAYYLQGRKGIKRALWLGGVLLIITLPFLLLMYPQSISITLSGRLPLWTGSIDAILQKPVIGYGFGPRSVIIEQYTPDQHYAGIGPHNGYLSMTLQLGIFGGIAYISLILASIFEHFNTKGPDVILIMVLSGFVIIMVFAEVSVLVRGVHPILFTLVVGYLLRPNAND